MLPEATKGDWIVSPLKAGSILVALGIIAFVLIRLGMMQADWEMCFGAMPGGYTEPPFADQVRAGLVGAVQMLTEQKSTSKRALIFTVVFSPLLVIALARARWIWAGTLLLLLLPFWLVFDGDGHHCDRKGCVACLGVAIWVCCIQFPIIMTTFFFIARGRFISMILARSRGAGHSVD